MVDKDRVKGSAEHMKGKEWTGKVTGDKKTEIEGQADQVKGKARNAVGGLKDAIATGRPEQLMPMALKSDSGDSVGFV